MLAWPLLAILLRSVLQEDVPDSRSVSSVRSGSPALSRILLAKGNHSQRSERCERQSDPVKLDPELQKIKNYIVGANYTKLKETLAKWRGDKGYIHNLDDQGEPGDYSHMKCSDLGYLATQKVQHQEEVYNSSSDEAEPNNTNHTVLELALSMTRKAKERAMMSFLYGKWTVSDQDTIVTRRIKIVRLLLETGFLWGSGDLVCQVVSAKKGYHKDIREAFSRTILHDLVRNDEHLGEKHLAFLRKSHRCGGNDMNGVVWILAQAPGGFTQLGLLDDETVLMADAQDPPDHDEALIKFPDLVQLYIAMGQPLTTVKPSGWNAEMLAARRLRWHNVAALQRHLMDEWHQDYREAGKLPLLPAWITNRVQDAYVSSCLKFVLVARIGFYLFVLLLLVLIGLALHHSIQICYYSTGESKPERYQLLKDILRWISQQGGSLQSSLLFADITFRVLWLFVTNMALLQAPPLIIISLETPWWIIPGLAEIPPVTFWNPLPEWTALAITISVLFSTAIFVYVDLRHAFNWKKGNPEEDNQNQQTIPEDRFQDPTCHLFGCLCIFVLVFVLMVIYGRTILQPLEMNPKRMGLWLGALLVQVRITLDDKTLKQELLNLNQLEEALHDSEETDEGYCSMGLCNLPNDEESGPAPQDVDKKPADKVEFRRVIRTLLCNWFRWASCMVTPQNDGMWGLHLAALQKERNLEQDKDDKDVLATAESKREKNLADSKSSVVKVQHWSKTSILLRFMMSYISSGAYKAVIVYTLPLWLCRGSLVDFVLNAFALVYIVELDDLKDEQKVRWKLQDKESSAVDGSAQHLQQCVVPKDTGTDTWSHDEESADTKSSEPAPGLCPLCGDPA